MKNKLISKLKSGDVVALLISASVIFLFLLLGKESLLEKDQVVVTTEKRRFHYTLDQNQDIVAEGPLGETRIRIEEGNVFVVSSPCPHKICINSGKKSAAGEWIACLPNRVFIRISGEKDSNVDVIVE
jgi:hypothetical protein